MKKQKYAVIGECIENEISPFIHKRLFELAKIDAEYELIDIKAEEMENNMPRLNKLAGYIVSSPHKVSITNYLDKLDKKAQFYGAVNTVKNTGGVSKGYITDVYGFITAIKANNMPLEGKVVIIGAGGIAKVIACELAVKGCNPVVAVLPSELRQAAKLAMVIKEKVINMEIETCRIDRLEGNIDLLINATPVGTYPDIDACAVPESLIKECKNVIDLIYNPLETKLLKTAKANGANVMNGLSMLIWQAVKSHKIWNDVEFNAEDIKQLYEDAKKEIMKNE